jgi:hypothetical protein
LDRVGECLPEQGTEEFGSLVAQMVVVDVQELSGREVPDPVVRHQECDVRAEHADPVEFLPGLFQHLRKLVSHSLLPICLQDGRIRMVPRFPLDQFEKVVVPDPTQNGDLGREDLVL